MCGHVGLMGKFVTQKHLDAFKNLLYFDTIRGDDSTGVAVVSNIFTHNKEVSFDIFKSVGGASELFKEHGLGKNLTLTAGNIYLGHNRYATQGAVNVENAHPFEFDSVIGAHNGTVDQYSMRDFVGYKDFDIDSKIIFAQLNDTGKIEDVWEHADGAMALAWWDKDEELLNLIRNKERSLNFAYSKDDKVVFWASEAWMLQVALSRNGVEYHPLVEMKPDRLYSFALKDDSLLVSHEERDIAPFVRKSFWSNAYQGWNAKGLGGKQEKTWQDWLDDEDVFPAVFTISEVISVPVIPHAFGKMVGGKIVKIFFEAQNFNEVKELILKRGSKARYFTNKAREAKPGQEHSYYLFWEDVKLMKQAEAPVVSEVKKEQAKVGLVYPEKQGDKKVIELHPPKDKDTDNAPYYWGGKISKSVFFHKTKCGCAECDKIPLWEEARGVLWVSKDEFYCKACQDKEEVKDYLQKNYANRGY